MILIYCHLTTNSFEEALILVGTVFFMLIGTISFAYAGYGLGYRTLGSL